jgi:hypothetical protein
MACVCQAMKRERQPISGLKAYTIALSDGDLLEMMSGEVDKLVFRGLQYC